MANILGFITSSQWFQKVKSVFNATGGSGSAAKRVLANIVKSKALALPELGRLNELEGAGGFDFDLIETTYNNESLVRQAIDKYVDLMFKAGWALTGKNQASLDYVKARLALIAEGTKIPTEQLFSEIAEDFVLYHNAFIMKARVSGSFQFPAGVRVTPINNLQPIIGYFPVAPSTITIKRSPNGTVLQYQQEVEGNSTKLTIKPDDMIHMYRAKPRGKGFGVPFLTPVIADIKLLRIIEELVGKLIYKETFPIYVFTVGSDTNPATDQDIDDAKAKMDAMPLDGMLFVSERNKLDVVGAAKEVLNIQSYLSYFEQRVFTGLGVSETLMGRGSTSNKSTADNLTAQMNDKIKSYQRAYSSFIDQKMINDLLMEGGFDPVLNIQDAVHFEFKEIDLDNKVKLENQAMQKFLQNATTWEEMRTEIGMDPVADEKRLFFQMVTGYLDAQAATLAAQNRTTNANSPSNQHTSLEDLLKQRFEEDIKRRDRIRESYKESITTPSALMPKDHISDFVSKIDTALEQAKEDIIEICSTSASAKNVEMVIDMTSKYIQEHASKYANVCFYGAVNNSARNELDLSKSPYVDYSSSRVTITNKYAEALKKIMGDLQVSIANTDNSSAAISSAFEIYSNRIIYVLRDMGFAAYNMGIVALAKKLDIKELYVKNNNANSDCALCQSYANRSIIISDDFITPPFHNHCTCILTFKRS